MGSEMYVELGLLLLALVGGTLEAQGTGQRHVFKSFKKMALQNLASGMSDMDSFWREDLQQILIPRVPGTAGNKKVQQHIAGRMEKFGWTVQLDEFVGSTPLGPRNFTNVIATYKPERATRHLVLACHFDSKNMTSQGFQFLGATDSAIPCSILIDTAKHLQCLLDKGTTKPEYANLTLTMLFLDGEEAFVQWTATDSIYGARHLAEKWETEMHPNNPSVSMLNSIEAFVLLDLIGSSDTHFMQLFDETKQLYEALYNIERVLKKEQLLETTRIPKEIFSKHSRRGGIEDDHIPFLRRGVPILHLISVPFPTVWHTAEDNADAYDPTLTDNFSRIFRVFVARYLHLPASKPLCKNQTGGTGDGVNLPGSGSETNSSIVDVFRRLLAAIVQRIIDMLRQGRQRQTPGWQGPSG